MRRLAFVLMVALTPVVLAAVALGAYLNYGSIRQSYLDMVGARLETVARRIGSDAEAALSIGIPLAGQATMQRLLHREREADDILLSIDVTDMSGSILYSSDPERVGRIETTNADISEDRSVNIQNAFETSAGTVVVRASRKILDRELGTLADGIQRTALFAMLAALIGSFAAVLLGLRVLWTRVSRTAQTDDGAVVPRETVATFRMVDEAHRVIARQLAGDDGARRRG
tara:strand:- start:1186 stop:1872 length:687 start_codon:yes stop_codon:yes gene_type:complete